MSAALLAGLGATPANAGRPATPTLTAQDAAPAPTVSDSAIAATPADDRVLVTVDPGRGEALSTAVAAFGGAPVQSIAGDTVIVDPAPGATVDTAAVSAIPGVRTVEPNMRIHAFAAPNDPYYTDQYGLFDDQPGGARAESGWNGSTGSREVVVGVLDTGILVTHPDLRANMWTNRTGINGCPYGSHGWDATSASTNLAVRCNPQDFAGHGTLVAGILGAVGNNGVGISGATQKVSMMSLKMLDSNGDGSVADAVEAIDFGLAAKARGVNLRVLQASWGGYNPAPSEQSALHVAIQRAENAGVLFVTASGNGDNALNPRDLDQPGNDVLPCEDASAAVICVAASTNNGTLASYSNYGATTVDIAAPGSQILSTIPRNLDPQCPINSDYCFYNGTSMATPMVSGAAVDVLSAEPNLSLSQLKSRLLTSATTLDGLTDKVATNGRLDICNAMPNCGGLPMVPPTVPTNFTAVVHSGGVDLRWSKPDSNGNSSTISGYEVSGPNGVVSLPLTATSYTMNGLANNTSKNVRIRAFGSGGTGPWATKLVRPHAGGYIVDPRGTVSRYAVGGKYPTSISGGPAFPFDIARGIAIVPEGTGGYVVDGYGGLHRFRIGAASPLPPVATGGPYWLGWDIVRGVALSSKGGGYVLDGFGGLHPFGSGAGAPPGTARNGPYWLGWDITRGVTLNATGTGGYVVD
ncbi:MAG: S8 family serine peptidase, partial [Acidimicrobiia bacterium]|nr:S8 family serine peptidase [Acidimicrobiia bacterium]